MFNILNKLRELISLSLNKVLIPQDKANHIVYGLVLYSILGLWNTYIALLLTVVIAISKEIYDKFGVGTSDWKDLVATILIPILLELLRIII